MYVSESLGRIKLSVLIHAIENNHRFLLFTHWGDLTFRNREDFPHERHYDLRIDGLKKRQILDFCCEHNLEFDNDLSMPLRSLGTLPIGDLAWKTLTDRRRRLLDKAITYYFEHLDDPLPPDAYDDHRYYNRGRGRDRGFLTCPEPRIGAIETRFKIDLRFLRDRLEQIYTDVYKGGFYETGELPFAPELNVKFHDMGMLLADVDEIQRHRHSWVG